MSRLFFTYLSLFLALAQPALAQTDAARTPTGLRVPALAADEESIVLVWEKPVDMSGVVDYRVYMDGKPVGTANENAARHSPAQPYINKFYESDTEKFHVRVSHHNFTATGLKPATEYAFTVRAVYADGKESADSNRIVQKTSVVAPRISIADHGAKGDGATLNTEAIQKAIAACPSGCRVVVPAGVFKTGAIWLKSNMTLEISEGATLLGSERPQDYPPAYRLYPYSTTLRAASLINAYTPDSFAHGLENIRIVGKGRIDGNGWKPRGDGSITDEIGNELPQLIPSNRNRVSADGVLAAAATAAAVKGGMDLQVAYGQMRPSLITIRGAKNVYYAGFTALNPAFHGIMNLDTENVTVNGVIHKTYDGNNADGIEFGNSRNVMVFNNFFDTGDDCVNFAAGTGEEALKHPPMSGAWIFNNYFREGHGAVVMGSHTGGWIEKVLAEDNVAFLTDVGLRMKSTVFIGGGVRDILFRDNAIRRPTTEAFIFTLDYADPNAKIDYPPAKVPAQFRNIVLRNVSVESGEGRPFMAVQGDPKANAFHESFRLESVRLKNVVPARLVGLKNSVFHDVTFIGLPADKSPWSVSDSSGLNFTGTTPKP